MLQSYDDLINDSRNTHVTVQGTRGGKPRYYLHIVKRCLQLQAVNLWVSGGEDGSKYSLDATPPYSSSLSFFHRRYPSSFALQRASLRPGQPGQHHPPHRGIPIYPLRAFFHPRSCSTVQNENTQLIVSPVPSHTVSL